MQRYASNSVSNDRLELSDSTLLFCSFQELEKKIAVYEGPNWQVRTSITHISVMADDASLI